MQSVTSSLDLPAWNSFAIKSNISAKDILSIKESIKEISSNLVRNSAQLRQFIDHRNAFGKNLLNGEYDLARKELASMHQSFGASIYLADKALLLSYFSEGKTECQHLSDEMCSSVSDSNVEFCIREFQLRMIRGKGGARAKLHVHQRIIDYIPDATSIQLIFLYFITNSIPVDVADGAKLICNCIRFLTPIDSYFFTLKLLRILLASNTLLGDLSFAHRCLRILDASIQDPQIRTLLIFSSPPIQQGSEAILPSGDGRLVDAYDQYYKGDFDGAIASSFAGAQLAPAALGFYQIAAKAISHCSSRSNESVETASPSLSKIIVTNLAHLYREDSAPQRFTTLLRSIGIRLGDNLIGIGLNLICDNNEGKTSDPVVDRYCDLHHRFDEPITIFDFPEHVSHLYELFKKLYSKRPTIAFQEVCLFGETGLSEHLHPIFYNLARLRWCSANNRHEEIIATCSSSRTVAIFADDKRWNRQLMQHHVDALIALERYSEAIDILVEAVLTLPNYILLSRIRANLSHIIEFGEEDLFDVRLCYLNVACTSDSFGRYEFIARLFEEAGFLDPVSHLQSILSPDSVLIYELYGNYCDTDVLMCMGFWETEQQALPEVVQTVRVSICRELFRLYPEHQEDVIREVITSGSALKRMQTTASLGASRLRLDCERVQQRIREVIAPLASSLHFNSSPSAQEGLEFFLEDFTIEVSTQAIEKAFDAFLWDSHVGFATALSTRVRHTVLRSAVRAPLLEYSLIVDPSTDIPDVFKGIDDVQLGVATLPVYQRNRVSHLIQTLSKKVEYAINIFLQDRFKIYCDDSSLLTPKRRGLGIIGSEDSLFRFSDIRASIPQIRALGLLLRDDVDKASSVLYGKFESEILRILPTVRNCFVSELERPIIEALDQAVDAVPSFLLGREAESRLQSRIRKARDSFRNKMIPIKEWFDWSNGIGESKMGADEAFDFALELLGRTRSNICKLYKDPKTIEITGSEACHFVDVFINLCDNAIEYGINTLKVDLEVHRSSESISFTCKSYQSSISSDYFKECERKARESASRFNVNPSEAIHDSKKSGIVRALAAVEALSGRRPSMNVSYDLNVNPGVSLFTIVVFS